MREIKFRAWVVNPRRNILGSPIRAECKMIYDIIDLKKELIEQYIPFEECDSIEFMQFTGLKDKNGKEIYEGDIVKIKRNDGMLLLCSISLDLVYGIIFNEVAGVDPIIKDPVLTNLEHLPRFYFAEDIELYCDDLKCCSGIEVIGYNTEFGDDKCEVKDEN